MDQEQGEAFPPSYYIECTPPIIAFVDWARTAPDDDDPADDPPVLDPTARLLSVIGPPGCGKTWFLVQLHAALADDPGGVLVLPLLDLKQDSNLLGLRQWFANAINVVNARGIGYPLPQRIVSALQLGNEVSKLCAACGARDQIVVIVLVDGFEEIGTDRRQDIESFLAGVLVTDNVKIVLTRRDEQAFTENLLRWANEQEVALALPTPEEQIRQRLAWGGQVVVDWLREPWEDELDQRIATMAAADRAAVLPALAGHLTLNPYINVRLLALILDDPLLPPATLKRRCLESYLDRAGLNADNGAFLEEVVRIIRSGGSTNHSFTKKQIGSHLPQSDQLEALMVAGIVSQISGTDRYHLDPAVAALI